ncbi:hypothetical protein D3C75_876770 [compost metagenome]
MNLAAYACVIRRNDHVDHNIAVIRLYHMDTCSQQLAGIQISFDALLNLRHLPQQILLIISLQHQNHRNMPEGLFVHSGAVLHIRIDQTEGAHRKIGIGVQDAGDCKQALFGQKLEIRRCYGSVTLRELRYRAPNPICHILFFSQGYAQQLKKLQLALLCNLVNPVQHHFAEPCKKLNQRDAGVGGIIIRPFRIIERDQRFGIGHKLIKSKIIQVWYWKRHGSSSFL